MKRFSLVFLVFFLVFIVAVSISPALIDNKGYILVAMGDITIESSVVTASIFLFLLFVFLLFTLKLIRGGFRFGRGAWHKFAFANKRKAEKQFNQGVAAYLIADYGEAEKLLVQSAGRNVFPIAGYGLAASAAEKQHLTANCEYYLDCLAQLSEGKTLELEQVLMVITQQMVLKNYAKARQLLDAYHKHLGHDHRLFAQELNLSLIEQHYQHVIDYLPKVMKQKQFSKTQIDHWCYQAFFGQFKSLLKDKGQQALTDYWQALNKKLKQHSEVTYAYCYVLSEIGATQALEKLLLPIFKFDINEQTLARIKALPLQQSEALLNQAQKYVHQDNHNIKWLSCLGWLALENKNYDLACKVYASLFKLTTEVNKQDIVSFARALTEKNELSQANQLLLHYSTKLLA